MKRESPPKLAEIREKCLKGLVDALREERDVVQFARGCGVEPTEYQAEAMRHPSKRKVYLWGRQSGKTMTTAMETLWLTLFQPEKTALIVSSSMNQSQELMNHVHNFLKIYRERHPQSKAGDILRENTEEICFKNGSRILVRPGTANIRGYRAHLLIIDEAAQVPDELIQQAAPPVLTTTGGTMILISTPHVVGIAFDDACRNRKVFTVFGPVATEQNPFADKQLLADMRDFMTEDNYKQEYMAIQVSQMSNVFSQEQIDKCVYHDKPPAQSGIAVGVDLAKTTDWSVFTAVQPNGYLVAMEEYKRLPYPDIVDRLRVFVEHTRAERMLVDQTGLGDAVLDDIYKDFRTRGMGLVIDGVVLTHQAKTEIINNLRNFIEKQKVRIPDPKTGRPARKLYQQLMWFRYERLEKSGLLRTCAPEGKHDDYVIALALACYQLRDVGNVTLLRGLEKL